MAACERSGNSDMYGLGIRTGFYIQWFGIIAAPWMAEEEVQGLRFGNALFITATFLALVIQTSLNALLAVDVYIVLLLTFGSFYWFVPLYLWRLIIGCNPLMDPSRWPLVPSSALYGVLSFALLVTVACYQLWFWTTGINTVQEAPTGCTDYGFLFAMTPLHNRGFIAFNVIFNIALLCIATAMLAFQAGLLPVPRWLSDKEEHARRHSPSAVHLEGLLMLQTFFNLIVATVVILATELKIEWNSLNGVDDVTSAGQTIPIVIAVGMVGRLIYIRIFKSRVSPTEQRQIRMNEFFNFPDLSSSEGSSGEDEIASPPPRRRRRRRRSRSHRAQNRVYTVPPRTYRRNRSS